MFNFHFIKTHRSIRDSSYHILCQLQSLWKQPLIGYFFESLPSLSESESVIALGNESDTKGNMKGLLFFWWLNKDLYSLKIFSRKFLILRFWIWIRINFRKTGINGSFAKLDSSRIFDFQELWIAKLNSVRISSRFLSIIMTWKVFLIQIKLHEW